MPTPVSLPQYASSYLENRSFAQGRTVYAYERLGGGQQSAIDSALRGSPLIAAKRNARWRQRSQVSSFWFPLLIQIETSTFWRLLDEVVATCCRTLSFTVGTLLSLADGTLRAVVTTINYAVGRHSSSTCS